MKLNFEVIKQVGSGGYPDIIHFPNTQAQVFSLTGGELYGKPTNKIDNGEWTGATFQNNLKVSPDIHMGHFQVDVLPGFGIVGGYKQNDEDKHKLIIYEFAFEMDRYLRSGSIKHSLDTPISTFTLTLENPDLKDPEHPGNAAINEENSLLSPGAKVIFKFKAGDSEEFDLGELFVDRSSFSLLSETADVDGRNLIGKAIKDQTLDEAYKADYNYIHLIIEDLLKHAKLDSGQYLIENSAMQNWFDFKRNMDIMSALEEIFKATINWRMEELPDGTVVVGSPQYAGFTQRGNYTFHRNKDIFSREITRDDLGAYRRVCIHDSEFTLAVYADVQVYSGWNLQANKTLYVQVPDGTRQAEGQAFALEIARRLENVGKVESFSGPFRPHIIPGDGAIIVDNKGSKSLGLITEVTHNFGKNGFITEFSVDSGGRLGRGRLTDYISMITKGKGAGSIGYEEIPPDIPDPVDPPDPNGGEGP